MSTPVQLPPFFREAEFDVRGLAVPYHIADPKLPHHWEHTGAGEGILIGVCDTGVDASHPELSGKIVDSESFVRGSAMDGNGHGTHVASTIAGESVGVAPLAKLAIAKVLRDNGAGDSHTVAQGIGWLAERGCQIINLSLGGATDDPYTRDAVLDVVSSGVLVLAATGNERSSHVGYPAVHCIAVGAVDRALRLAYFSNRGKDVDLVGYGVDIFAAIPHGRYATYSGTSMATPWIAGLVANRLSAELRHLGKIVTTSAQELLKLETLVVDLGPEGRDTSYGRGFPDLNRAFYEQLTPPVPDPPIVIPPQPPEPIMVRLEGLRSGAIYKAATVYPESEQ